MDMGVRKGGDKRPASELDGFKILVFLRELVPDEKDFSAVLRKIFGDGILFVAGDNGTLINFHKLITAVSFYNRRPAPPLASIYHKFPAVKSRKAGKFCFR